MENRILKQILLVSIMFVAQQVYCQTCSSYTVSGDWFQKNIPITISQLSGPEKQGHIIIGSWNDVYSAKNGCPEVGAQALCKAYASGLFGQTTTIADAGSFTEIDAGYGLLYDSSAQQFKVDLNQVTVCPYTGLQVKFLCVNGNLGDWATAVVSPQININIFSDPSGPTFQFGGLDLTTKTNAYGLDPLNNIVVFSQMTDYAICSGTVSVIDVATGSAPDEVIIDSISGKIEFTREYDWYKTFQLQICDSSGGNCQTSDTTFTLTVTDCSEALANSVTLNKPSLLTQNLVVYRANTNSQPVFTTFDAFTFSDPKCKVQSVVIEDSVGSQVHGTLTMTETLTPTYTVGLTDLSLKNTIADYIFYIRVTLLNPGTFAVKYAQISSNTTFTLRVYGCYDKLSFLTWTPLVANPIERDLTQASQILIQTDGSQYSQTSDSVNCQITSYSMTIDSNTGTGTEMTLDPSTGTFQVYINVDYINTFRITICADSETTPAFCLTQLAAETLHVNYTMCKDFIGWIGTFNDYPTTIEALATGSTTLLKAANSFALNYLSPLCDITSYALVQVSNVGGVGDASELVMDSLTGEFTVNSESEYLYTFNVVVCGRLQTSGDHCITSGPFTVDVKLIPGCSSRITFTGWSPSFITPLEYFKTATSDTQLQADGSEYFSTDNLILCPIDLYLHTHISGPGTQLTISSATGSIAAAITMVYQDQFTITACGRSTSASYSILNDCVTTPLQTVIVQITQCKQYLEYLTWNPLVASPEPQSLTNVTDVILQNDGTAYLTESEPVNCLLTSYGFVDVTSTGSLGNELSIDTAVPGGQIIARVDMEYVFTFKLEACTRNAASGDINDCLQSSVLSFTVINICTLIPREVLPTGLETQFSADYAMNNSQLQVSKVGTINSIQAYDVDSSLLFLYSCPIVRYTVEKVWDALNQKILTPSDQLNYFDFDTTTGLVTFKQFGSVMDIFILVKASNNLHWTPDTINPQIRFAMGVPDDPFVFNPALYTNQPQEEIVYDINPPKFKSSIFCDTLILDLNEYKPLDYTCKMPAFQPSSIGTKATLQVASTLSALSYSEQDRSLVVNRAFLQEKVASETSSLQFIIVQIKIIDDKKEESEAYRLTIMIEIIEKKPDVIIANETIDSLKLTADIKEVNSVGLVTLSFSDQINNVSFNDINSTVLDLYIVPGNDRHIHDDNFNITKINFTWQIVEFQSPTDLLFQLDFAYPVEISPLKDPDRLRLHLIHPQNASLFYSPKLKASLSNDSWTLEAIVPTQMPKNDLTMALQDGSEDLKVIMMVLLVFSILLFIISSGQLASRFMFIMVRSLQLIMHLPMVQIIFPGNAMTLITILIPVVGFDVLEAVVDWESINDMTGAFNFEQHEQIQDKIFNQITEIGYETYNSLMILNTIGLVLFYYIFKLGLWMILKAITLFKKNEKLKKFVEQLQDGLFFSELIILYMQGFFEFLIAAILTYKMQKHDLVGERISLIICVISFFVCLIFMPLASLYVIIRDFETIKEENFKKRWGELYSNMSEKRQDRAARFFYFFFIIRRIIFVFMCFGLQYEPLIYEILILQYMNTFMLVYQTYFKPGLSIFENRVEIFNEFNVSLCSTLILCFTEWIESQELKFQIGWFFCILVLLQTVFNLLIIFYYSIRTGILVMIMLYRRIRARCSKKSDGEEDNEGDWDITESQSQSEPSSGRADDSISEQQQSPTENGQNNPIQPSKPTLTSAPITKAKLLESKKKLVERRQNIQGVMQPTNMQAQLQIDRVKRKGPRNNLKKELPQIASQLQAPVMPPFNSEMGSRLKLLKKNPKYHDNFNSRTATNSLQKPPAFPMKQNFNQNQGVTNHNRMPTIDQVQKQEQKQRESMQQTRPSIIKNQGSADSVTLKNAGSRKPRKPTKLPQVPSNSRKNNMKDIVGGQMRKEDNFQQPVPVKQSPSQTALRPKMANLKKNSRKQKNPIQMVQPLSLLDDSDRVKPALSLLDDFDRIKTDASGLDISEQEQRPGMHLETPTFHPHPSSDPITSSPKFYSPPTSPQSTSQHQDTATPSPSHPPLDPSTPSSATSPPFSSTHTSGFNTQPTTAPFSGNATSQQPLSTAQSRARSNSLTHKSNRPTAAPSPQRIRRLGNNRRGSRPPHQTNLSVISEEMNISTQ